MKLYLGNLSFKTTQQGLEKALASFKTKEINLIRDRKTGDSRGFAFVEFSDEVEYKKVFDMLKGYRLDGREVFVKEAIEHQALGRRDEDFESYSPSQTIPFS